MGLETATYIADLNPLNPTGLDPRAAGDDHLRLIKQVLQNTFPGANGPFLVFESGTKLLFAQAAAPIGWTQITTDSADNRMLRVVKTSGAGVGGTHSPILMDVVPGHNHVFTTWDQSQNHTHAFDTYSAGAHTHTMNLMLNLTANGAGTSPYAVGALPGTTGFTTDGAGAHTHSGVTGWEDRGHYHSGITNNNAGGLNWTPRYIDLILCRKN